MDVSAKNMNVNVCPRCGTVDGDLTVDGIKFECYEERHDRFHGVVSANEYLRRSKGGSLVVLRMGAAYGISEQSTDFGSYLRCAASAARDFVRIFVGGGK